MMMERVNFGDDLTVSRIVYGMWRLGDDADTSAATVQAKIESCLAQGITTMDQADIYGGYEAEEIMGAALKAAPALREQIEIVTKCDIIAPVGRYADAPVKYYDTSRAHITASVEHSLRLMGVEQIDCLLIHRPDPFMDHHETGAALDALVAEGKVRSVGVSNFDLHDWTLLQSGMKTPLVTNQIEVSLLENSAFTSGRVAYLQERGVRPMAWSPLAGGALFTADNAALFQKLTDLAADQNVTPEAVAVAWIMAHPAGIVPVLGTNNLGRIAQIGQAATVKMDRQTWFALYEAANGAEVP
jgi:predicted oxidoreductase